METLIDTIPSQNGDTRVEVWKTCADDGEHRLEIRFAAYHADLGWVVQRRIEMGDADAVALRAAIGIGGFTGETTRKARLARLPQKDNVVSLAEARRLIG